MKLGSDYFISMLGWNLLINHNHSSQESEGDKSVFQLLFVISYLTKNILQQNIVHEFIPISSMQKKRLKSKSIRRCYISLHVSGKIIYVPRYICTAKDGSDYFTYTFTFFLKTLHWYVVYL